MQDNPYAAPNSDVRDAVLARSSDTETSNPRASSISVPKLRLWELVVSWLILLISLLALSGPVLMITSNWRLVQVLYHEGELDYLPMVFPLIFIASSILLVLRRKWCLALFLIHFIATLAHLSVRNAFDKLPWYVFASFIGEVAIMYFCIHLLGKRILK